MELGAEAELVLLGRDIEEELVKEIVAEVLIARLVYLGAEVGFVDVDPQLMEGFLQEIVAKLPFARFVELFTYVIKLDPYVGIF